MRHHRESSFRRNTSGAVAAAYALALPALIAVGAVGFDYARMAGMDSELQNGADQAALAAASQLDGQDGARQRATDAAVGLVANQSLLGSGARAVTITAAENCQPEPGRPISSKVSFWQDKARQIPASLDSNAKFVKVCVDAKRADYALMPVIGLFQSGMIEAAAFAGLGSAICKLPPLFMCNPDSANPNVFDPTSYIGKGIRLVANDGGGQYGAGNFGYLNNDPTSSGGGAIEIAAALGLLNQADNCTPIDSVLTKPGNQPSVLRALNTRFDIYDSGMPGNPCNTRANCPPSANARIDLVRDGTGAGNCGLSKNANNGKGYGGPANPYLPDPLNPFYSDTAAGALSPMGYPRDVCHAVSNTGNCSGGSIGDGVWDRNAFFRSNNAIYGGSAPNANLYNIYGDPKTPTAVMPTRYQLYRYEYANGYAKAPICETSGVPPTNAPDRRVLSVAVIPCTPPINGVSSAKPITFVDVFLIEPSASRARTEQSDVYVEVMGVTTTGGGATQGQSIRKDTPYLIE